MYYREYTCVKKFGESKYVCYPGIVFISEANTFEDYQIIKVPYVEVSGIESLYYGTLYFDRHFIKERLQTNLIKFK